MARMGSRTTMGGGDGRFHTTCWTMIVNSQLSTDEQNMLVINDLLGKYWKPVYCYLRRKGYNNEPAKDMTQGFFQEIVLGRELIKQADKTRGKFRTFLLSALDRYIIDLHRYNTRAKRKPMGHIFHLDDLDLTEESLAIPDITAEEGFNCALVSQLLDEVITDAQDECERTAKEKHWLVFAEKVLNPILYNTKAPSLAEICQKCGIENEIRASSMITTVKRRLRKHLQLHLQRIVGEDTVVEEEIAEILKKFTG